MVPLTRLHEFGPLPEVPLCTCNIRCLPVRHSTLGVSPYDSVPTPETKVLTLTQWRTGVTGIPDRTARVVRCHTCGCVVKSPHYRTCGEKKVVKEGKRKKADLTKCSERLANRSLEKKIVPFLPSQFTPPYLDTPFPRPQLFFLKKKNKCQKSRGQSPPG